MSDRGVPPEPDFRRLFEAVPTPTMVLDADLVMIAMNDAYLAVAGATREDLVGRTPMEAFPDNPDDPSASGVSNLTQSLRTVLATGRPDTMALQRYDVQTGPGGSFEERYWSPVNTPVLDADGKVAYIIHRVEEVTDYVRARGAELERATAELRTRAGRLEADLIGRAREVQDVNRQLREVNDHLAAATEALLRQQAAKDRFIALLSHELRNPLAALRAAIDLLSLDVPPGHPAVAVLERQVGALVRMTDDLLDSSRALTGRLTLLRQLLDLRDIVATVAGDLRPQFERGERALSVTVGEAALPVDGDRVRLAQIVGNLLRNAFSYTHPGGTVGVALARTDGEAVLTVRDDGMGFDPADAGTLFEVFSRGLPSGALSDAGGGRAGRGDLPPPARGEPGGLGLGLGLVRSIAELHGGQVSAHSDGPGKGARFEVRLPLAEPGRASAQAAPERARPAGRAMTERAGRAVAPPAGPREPRAHPVAEAGTTAPSVPRRTLIIEDNEDLAASYQVLLERGGDQVTVAHTGKDGLAAARRGAFDLVLCDIGLPDLGGREVARRLRRHPRRAQMRVIAVSGFSQQADRERSLRAGFDAHLVKPMALADLDAALAGWSPG